MTSVGRRPTLGELLQALFAIATIEADADVLDIEKETFRVVLTFTRDKCPPDWRDGQPKPTWFFEQLGEELAAWEHQRICEEQWVSKEEALGSSIDTLMAHYAEELKKTAAAHPETFQTRMDKRIFIDTILRLKELKERREAGGVYSSTESRREKARKSWEEEEFEAPKREEAQRRYRAQPNHSDFGFTESPYSEDSFSKEWAEATRKRWERVFEETIFGGFQNRAPPRTPSGRTPWHVTLGVSVTATKAQITGAYRKLAAKYHPDRYKEADGHAKMAAINTARDEGLKGL